jgi:hypothetical protein
MFISETRSDSLFGVLHETDDLLTAVVAVNKALFSMLRNYFFYIICVIQYYKHESWSKKDALLM